MSIRKIAFLLTSVLVIAILSSCSSTQEIEIMNSSYETPVAEYASDDAEVDNSIIEEVNKTILESDAEDAINVVCKPSFALDALAAIGWRWSLGVRDDIPYVKEQIEKNFEGIEIPADSNYFSTFIDTYSLDEIEAMDLDLFAESFQKCIKGNTYEDQFIRGLEILKEMDFANLWEEYCLPYLNKQCDEYNSLLEAEQKMALGLFSDVQKLKPNDKINDINIYLTYFTYPVSLQLTTTSYLTNHDASKEVSLNTDIYSENLLRIMAHELLHRVSNGKSTAAYIEAYQTDELLKKTNKVLFEKKGSPSNEEEFVVALDHYIGVKNGLATKEEAFNSLFNYYSGCMPIAVIIFDELMKLEEIPEDINSWIYDLFANEVIKIGDVENKVNSILPGYTDNFMSIWFYTNLI